MNKTITLALAVLTAGLLLTADADAKRLGGGRSFGAPRDTVTQRQAMPPAAAPSQPAAPTNNAVAPRAPAATPAAPAPAAQSGWRRFMGPIAGIAAGLGIAALLSHFGLSE